MAVHGVTQMFHDARRVKKVNRREGVVRMSIKNCTMSIFARKFVYLQDLIDQTGGGPVLYFGSFNGVRVVPFPPVTAAPLDHPLRIWALW